jgi:hypothetical protein
LHDFHVIAGGIFRRKQAEERPGCAGDAVHVALEGFAAGINMNFGLLSHTHVAKLRLFKVRGDPDLIERHDSEQLLAGLHVHADDDRFIHLAADRGDNFRVLQVQLGLLQRGALLFHVGNRGAGSRLGRRNLLRPGFRGTMIGYGAFQAATGLAHGFQRRSFVGLRGRDRRGAGSGGRQRLIVDLVGHLFFVHQQLVAM